GDCWRDAVPQPLHADRAVRLHSRLGRLPRRRAAGAVRRFPLPEGFGPQPRDRSACDSGAHPAEAQGSPEGCLMIAAENIHVTFNRGTPLEHKALRGVSLTLADGEFVTVIGSNGAGKSTLLGAIAGDVTPEKGVIRVGADDVTREKPALRARRVARVFQDPLAGSCANLSIEENLALAACRGVRRGLGLALNGARRARLRDRVAELGLGLENRMGDRMGLLSGGQRQALALVMA